MKMVKAKIIMPLRYLEWVDNLFPTIKINREIRLCVDFINLNKASLRDNYPLPKMDYILQNMVRSLRLSIIDGFSWSNQITMHLEVQKKIAFTTPWGTFMYAQMHFDLMNVGSSFQRAMDIMFFGEKDKFVVIYLDDIIVFSKSDEEHLRHLQHTFEKFRKYGLSLNPKKPQFSLKEGKLLGHIVSKEGVRTEPKRVEVMSVIPSQSTKRRYMSSWRG